MKIGIIGTRGIPNYHGGFEQFAEFFALHSKKKGHDVYVYNSHVHPYKKKEYKGVKIIHSYDPESKIGTIGQFIYDLNCIRDSRKRDFDIILQLGYTSSSVWGWILPARPIIITNMDGLEWKRSKYSKNVQKFLLYAEKLAVKTSDYLISDSLEIQSYIKEKYKRDSEYIAYGANVFVPNIDIEFAFQELSPNEYFLLIARMEPENNIEMILDGYVSSNSNYPFCVVGNTESTSFGSYIKNKFDKYEGIRFFGAIYDLEVLNNIRYNSRLYFHGHSVGGTNPSLLEAMASSSLIASHRNDFNYAILEDDAFYFKSADEVAEIIQDHNKMENLSIIKNNIKKIMTKFSWEFINKSYLSFFKKCLDE
ncbi:DUF1972 domain-containing protein [Winogradskyella luteola]|uniref:DUF1972 domain-containing protein n=1 Tax=Winogradskyella luteola TaxID=2828330 RepID=A0A9X1F8Q8_9FLAO|nr:DUF1972 domain-containing protein [Winogradskyella luteola]MBV7269166.1 DUF1972 domain-containing protein [Winogradskyella luteola]